MVRIAKFFISWFHGGNEMNSTAHWGLAGMLLLLAADVMLAQGQGQGQIRGPRTPQAAAENRELRAAARLAREPNPRATRAQRRDGRTLREERQRLREERTAQRPERGMPVDRQRPEFGRDVALRQQLAEVDRLRDEALLTGDQALLDRADTMELEIRDRFARVEATAQGPREMGRFTTGPIESVSAIDVEPLPQSAEIERGLGRETARQVRGLPPIEGEHELGAPGYGRRTAAERRYLRGDDPRGPWDAQSWPQPQQPTPSDGEPLPPTEPVTESPPEISEQNAESVVP
jgi:hypothetical protein